MIHCLSSNKIWKSLKPTLIKRKLNSIRIRKLALYSPIKLKKVIAISLFSYYLLGSILLPLGDFSTVADLPAMYKHCKATEDADLDVYEFITEHLIGVAVFFDDNNHHKSDDKPHKPFHSQFQHQLFQIFGKNEIHVFTKAIYFLENLTHSSFYTSNYSFQTISSIFHPPTTV